VSQGAEEKRDILLTIKRRKTKWIGRILYRKCLLKHVNEGKIEGRIEVTGRRGRRRKQLLDDLKENYMEIERESTRSQSVENALWKRLWTCQKTENSIND
jgi:hypothetical protein